MDEITPTITRLVLGLLVLFYMLWPVRSFVRGGREGRLAYEMVGEVGDWTNQHRLSAQG